MSLRNIAFAVTVVASAAVCVRLGVWQLDRLGERRATNGERRAIRLAPPVDIERTNEPILEGRRVHARGRYLADRTIVLRGRVYQGTPGVVLATPMAFPDDDSITMVIRGFIPAPDAATVDPRRYPPGDSALVVGSAVLLPDSGGQPVVGTAGSTTWRRLAAMELGERLSRPVRPFAIQILPDSGRPDLPIPLPSEPLDDGPHLSYAIQWFAFATIALVGGWLWIRHQW